MWLVTPFGFFSIVRKDGGHDLTVRARVQQDLEELQRRYLPSLGGVQEHAGTDYQYRATVSQTDLAEAMKRIVLDIDYANFKDEVAQEQGSARAHVYGTVWSALRALHTTRTEAL